MQPTPEELATLAKFALKADAVRLAGVSLPTLRSWDRLGLIQLHHWGESVVIYLPQLEAVKASPPKRGPPFKKKKPASGT